MKFWSYVKKLRVCECSFKVCSESLDTKFRNCDNSEDLSAILKIFFGNCRYCEEAYFLCVEK